ncbi:distal membrane-arm assembly complex protein 2 [Anabrus simplex]|uniref:distal membrane-arm assembly complex protein 2 n=1 Tax=Anabrus simplex TaxID=316456 RepID=UPI0035A3ABCC
MSVNILRKNLLTRKLTSYSSVFNTVVRFSSADDTKEKKPFRIPWHQQEGEWYSAFKLFAPEKGMKPDIVRFLQTPIDLRPQKIRKWWLKRKELKAIMNQGFIPERHEILGNDLAAAHFIVYRNGSIKFCGRTDWVKQNEEEEYDLPEKYVPDLYVEAIDASNMPIYYEGLRNLYGLKHLKWLSFNSCPYFDDWCMDRISGEYMETLEYLDISNCRNVTERGLCALYRFQKLQTLKVHNLANSKTFQLVCLLLEDIMPNLKIDGVEYMKLEENV